MEKKEVAQLEKEEEDDEGIVNLDDFFVDRDYELTEFKFGTNELHLFCLRSASTDFDLTGQLVWPGAVLMNNYLSNHAQILNDKDVIELGSGIGITGILCSRFCREVVLTDHNDEVLEIIQKNIELESSTRNTSDSGLATEKLEWGNEEHTAQILQKHPHGFGLILGADIYILFTFFFLLTFIFQHASVPPLFSTVKQLLQIKNSGCKFILAYVSRAKTMDKLVVSEAERQGMQVKEVKGTRTSISNLEGVIFEITIA
ncbi:hypothetical protein LUZ60_014107 [Juncus effusus]|nr:hypothetical protein LUZ60_014107 [Juncus effusus]